MKKLLTAGSQYLREMDLTDMALLKLCMAAFGILIGLSSAKRHKKSMGFLAGLAFIGTAIPLIAKFLGVISSSED